MAENNKSHADLRGNIFSILKEYTCINHLLIMLIFFQSHSETELSKVLHMKTKKKKKKSYNWSPGIMSRICKSKETEAFWFDPQGLANTFNPQKSVYLANYCWTQEVVIDKLHSFHQNS